MRILVTGVAASSAPPSSCTSCRTSATSRTLDALTYAANPISLAPLDATGRHRLIEADNLRPRGRARRLPTRSAPRR